LAFQGATDQSFVIPTNGIYACIISRNVCVDTSACIVINNVGVDSDSRIHLQFYPNPTLGNLTINLGKTYSHGEIIVFDGSGTMYHKTDLVNQQHIKLPLEKLKSGVYFFRVDINGYKHHHFKFIKK